MAALRRRDGVTMSELSRMLLVSNGNATAVVDWPEAEANWRTLSETDRRTVYVALTETGLASLETLATDHERGGRDLLGPLRGRSGPLDRSDETDGKTMTSMSKLKPVHFLWRSATGSR